LPTVAVVVPTFNRRDNLPRVIAPLLEDGATTELVVVVDGCRDGSLELVQEMARADPRIRPVFIENAGPARAHQTGVEAATAEVVLLLDDDVVARPGLVTGHARHHASADVFVVVGYMPTAVPPGRRAGDFTTRLYAQEYEECCARYERDRDLILRELWGGNVSLRRADCLRIPVHSDAFPERYHEDTDFGIRCARAGLRGVFDRALLATHAHRRSVDGFRADARREGAGRVWLARVHPDVAAEPEFAENLPRPLAAAVEWAADRRVYGVLAPALALLSAAAARLHLLAVEEVAGRLLRRVEQRHGAAAVDIDVANRGPWE
jgi:glycosyltransferase involved in cell wall biosynthesis